MSPSSCAPSAVCRRSKFMTRISDYDSIPSLSVTDSSAERTSLSSTLQPSLERLTPIKTASASSDQTDLISRGIIPKFELHNDTASVQAKPVTTVSWNAARVDAMRESNQNITVGNNIHKIRFGDTLWDIATASMKKQTGQAPNNTEIANEVARIAKKNGVNPNSIPLGTAIDTSPDKGSRQATTLAPLGRPESFRPPTQARTEPLLQREKPVEPRTQIREQPIEAARRQVEQANPGERTINLKMPVSAQAKQAASWNTAHSNLASKAATSSPDVAFYGDSITAGLSLNSSFKTAFGGRAENFGISGDRTENLLYRLKNGEADFRGKKPDTAVISIGTNDIGSASESRIVAGILANTKEAIAKMPGTEIVVVGILPRGQRQDDSLRQTVNSINSKVREQLQGVPNVKFVDISPALLDSNGNMRRELWQGDNVHLTYGPGYSAMLRALQPHIKHR